jgi:hypothetical protein
MKSEEGHATPEEALMHYLRTRRDVRVLTMNGCMMRQSKSEKNNELVGRYD